VEPDKDAHFLFLYLPYLQQQYDKMIISKEYKTSILNIRSDFMQMICLQNPYESLKKNL